MFQTLQGWNSHMIEGGSLRKAKPVDADDFISSGMFRIAQRELEWRKFQAEEIKAMLFRTPQPKILQNEIKHIQSNVVIEVHDEENEKELADLEIACDNLDAAIGRIGESDVLRREKGIQMGVWA
jgi:hypothetical protein